MPYYILKVEQSKRGTSAISWEVQLSILTVIGKEMSSNEDSIATKSNYNPVRQFKHKPDKHRIEFFILANAPGRHIFIYLIYVYQVKNV